MKDMFRIEDMCCTFGVSRSGYYSRLSRPVSQRAIEEVQTVKPAIRKAFVDSRGTYGCVRISEALDRMGITIGPRRAARIMHEERLGAKAALKFKRTTMKSNGNRKCPDLVNRNFASDVPHRVWRSDFTPIWTEEGWLYLAVFLDICTRMIVGWAVSDRMTESVLIRALNDAVLKRVPLPSMIMHSDQGAQYFGKLFKAILNLYKIQQSMGSKCDCFDNAITESLWNTIKT
jgi:transposase InsO family protein